MVLILSSTTLDGVVKLLNERFYSTTYAINSQGLITWKNGEPKMDLVLSQKGNRYQVHQHKPA
jgi:hypothetical protein